MFEPLEDQVQQLIHRLAAVITGDLLMQMPPDPLDRIQVRRVLGQEVNHDPVAMLGAVGAGAALCGFSTVWIWVRVMRRMPHWISHYMAPRRSLQESAVTDE